MGAESRRLLGPGLAAILALTLASGAVASPPGAAGPAPGSSPAHLRSDCGAFDAENSPACADRGHHPADRGPAHADPSSPGPSLSAPHAPAPSQNPPAQKSLPQNSASQDVASTRPAPATPPPGRAIHMRTDKAKPRLWNDIRSKGIWLLAAGLAAALALAVALWALAVRRRPTSALRASQPTAYRRDLVLSDADGRSWRIPGSALSPGVCVGSDRSSLGYVNGSKIDKRHVEFWVSDGRLMMKPRSSKPIFLNDRALSPTECIITSTGDRLRLGDSEFLLFID